MTNEALNIHLFKAVSYSDREGIKRLVRRGANVNAKRDDNSTPLHSASARGDALTVKQLVELGAEINACDAHGQTPLHVATCLDNLEAAQQLIDCGASLRERDVDGQTPLDVAEFWGATQIAKLIRAAAQQMSFAERTQKRPIDPSKGKQ